LTLTFTTLGPSVLATALAGLAPLELFELSELALVFVIEDDAVEEPVLLLETEPQAAKPTAAIAITASMITAARIENRVRRPVLWARKRSRKTIVVTPPVISPLPHFTHRDDGRSGA
jgi:hypothetical protein